MLTTSNGNGKANPAKEVYYPYTDGEPMAETDTHRDAMIYAISSLQIHFDKTPNVYVSGNLFMYYVEGDPETRVFPDVFIVFGVPKYERNLYKVWKEGKGPDVVIEVTSQKTRHQDETEKPAIYAKLGVQEYFLYDPLREYLDPPLQGYCRTETGSYAPIPATRKHDQLLTIPSQLLNMELHLDGTRLRLYDTANETYLLSYEESVQVRHLIDEHVKLVEEQQQQAEEQRLYAEQQQQKVKELWQQADNHREQAEEHWQQAQNHWKQAEELFITLDEKLAYIRQPKPPKT